MGSQEDHKGFGALHHQFWVARTATDDYCVILLVCSLRTSCHNEIRSSASSPSFCIQV